MSMLTTLQFGAAMIPQVSARRVCSLIAAGRIKCNRINPRMIMIDERELRKVANRKTGRPCLNRAKSSKRR